MARPFDAVVFDFGGVIISPITRTIGRVADDLGLDHAALALLVMGPFDVSGDHPWHQVERGELSSDTLQAAITPLAEAQGIALRGDEIERILEPGVFDVHTEVLDRIRRLRDEGYLTGLLSNSTMDFRPTLEELVPPELFDVYIDSSAVGMRKPEPAIYAHLLEVLCVADPGRVVYLDDFPGNLAGAEAAGMVTIQVTDPHRALAELDRLLAG